MLAFSFATAALTASSGDLPGAGAERFVGGDGTSVTLARAGRQVVQLETAHYRGSAAFSVSHPAFLFAGKLADDPDRSYLIERRTTPSGVTRERLQELGPEGLTTLAEVSGDSYVVRSPGLIEVPARPRAGQTWTQSGTTRTPSGKGTQTWSTSGSVSAGENGCLRITLTETRQGNDPATTTETRCPGRGVTATSAFEGVAVDERATPPEAPDTTALTFAGPLDAGPRRLQLSRAGSPVVLTTIAGVGLTRAGTVVHSMVGDDLVFADDPPADSPPVTGGLGIMPSIPITLVRHPGGQPRTLAAFGDLVVVGTTSKQAVAYDSHGWRRWTIDLPDAPDQLARVGDDTFAVQTTSGSLQVRRIDTGALVWQRDLGVGEPAIPAVGGSGPTVVAAVAGEHVQVFDAETGTPVFDTTMSGQADAVAVAGTTVVVADATGQAVGFDLTGAVQWRYTDSQMNVRQALVHWSAGTSGGVGTTPDRVLLATDRGTRLLDARTGRLVARVGGDTRAMSSLTGGAGVGEAVVSLDGATWRLWSGDRVVASGTMSATPANSREILRGQGPAVAVSGSTVIDLWGRPA
ncbi:PQQ-binding-like beta-propeller repeat protein [Aestuariimicrobium soli]|uniref:outer membrane protein assembly factor BamB family protein n=1 Tax=Aestuariimicrobium soli TaxID=2035834 RepID=UPI003EBC65F6